ncbi:MAG: diguanylate cyclase [Eubacteriales bacterium]|nr:diguanylate cyclase [Eubacteriales bacterium]
MDEVKRTILIADASLTARVCVKKTLGSGYKYIEASSSEEALYALFANPDAALAIINIGIGGLDILKSVSENERLRGIPVIITADEDSTVSEKAAIALGAADYVRMPIIDSILRLRVRGVLCAAPAAFKPDGEAVNKELEQWRRQADYDAVTGIFNKEAFYANSRELINSAKGDEFVLVCWNIERFKLINDFYGMETGDSILKQMAQKCVELARGGAYGRIGSDHFALLIRRADFAAGSLLMAAQDLSDSAGITQEITSGFGVYFVEDNDMPIDKMCDRANLALQSIKGNYLERIGFYKHEMRDAILLEQRVRGEMNDALRNGDFKLYLQPVFSLTSGKPISAEVLVRWVHPQRGIISPSVFIPVLKKAASLPEWITMSGKRRASILPTAESVEWTPSPYPSMFPE